MTSEQIKKDFEAMDASGEYLKAIIGSSEHMFKAIIAATIDTYCIENNCDRFEILQSIKDGMEKVPL